MTVCSWLLGKSYFIATWVEKKDDFIYVNVNIAFMR